MRMGRSHLITRCEFRERIKGFVETYFSKNISRPDRSQFYVQIDLNLTSRSTLILRPIRPQFCVQFETSILRPIRFQFYIQFDFNFTSNSTSILRSIRPQFYIQFELNFTSNSTSILRPDNAGSGDGERLDAPGDN